jgi:hypothetical protein
MCRIRAPAWKASGVGAWIWRAGASEGVLEEEEEEVVVVLGYRIWQTR